MIVHSNASFHPEGEFCCHCISDRDKRIRELEANLINRIDGLAQVEMERDSLRAERDQLQVRERAYLSELADYAKTVTQLREELSQAKLMIADAEDRVRSWMNTADCLHRKYSGTFTEESK
jgi:chromosome segregation ATPase